MISQLDIMCIKSNNRERDRCWASHIGIPFLWEYWVANLDKAPSTAKNPHYYHYAASTRDGTGITWSNLGILLPYITIPIEYINTH